MMILNHEQKWFSRIKIFQIPKDKVKDACARSFENGSLKLSAIRRQLLLTASTLHNEKLSNSSSGNL